MSWNAEFIILIIISTLVDYFCGLKIYNTKSPTTKKFFLILSLFVNLGLLFAFKYFNFFNESITKILNYFLIPFNPFTLKIILPVGISFYTFQTLSYTIDVYRKKLIPEKHLGIFAVFVSFFPQLVAGPIERAKNLLPQFYIKQKFIFKRFTDGLKLMLWGFFKKIVIADYLAIIVNSVYNNPLNYSPITLTLATIFFAFQIYCDFSGYSDIAIGLAKIMGIKLMDNFKRPYFSKTISEFWKRWHISLSSWFKDYVYIPLGGNRVKLSRWVLNILIVFIVSGLWHGANWTFIIWGALHGVYLIFERLLVKTTHIKSKILKNTIACLQIIKTFILVNIGWIFFRANSVSDAIYILKNIFFNFVFNFSLLASEIGINKILYCFTIIGFMELVHLIQEHKGIRSFLDNKPTYIRWGIYIIIILSILLLGVFNNTEFIYFQF